MRDTAPAPNLDANSGPWVAWSNSATSSRRWNAASDIRSGSFPVITLAACRMGLTDSNVLNNEPVVSAIPLVIPNPSFLATPPGSVGAAVIEFSSSPYFLSISRPSFRATLRLDSRSA